MNVITSGETSINAATSAAGTVAAHSGVGAVSFLNLTVERKFSGSTGTFTVAGTLTAGNAATWTGAKVATRSWTSQGAANFVHEIAGTWEFNGTQYLGAYYSDGFVYLAQIPEPSLFGALAGALALVLAGTCRRRKNG